jgi:hypothetical protein
MEEMIDQAEQQAVQEEAHYWFALCDVVSHVDNIGIEKVLIDLSMLLAERKKMKQRKEEYASDELF